MLSLTKTQVWALDTLLDTIWYNLYPLQSRYAQICWVPDSSSRSACAQQRARPSASALDACTASNEKGYSKDYRKLSLHHQTQQVNCYMAKFWCPSYYLGFSLRLQAVHTNVIPTSNCSWRSCLSWRKASDPMLSHSWIRFTWKMCVGQSPLTWKRCYLYFFQGL